MISPQGFSELCPQAHEPMEWAYALNHAAREFEIIDRRFRMWLAQCCHECNGFTQFEENCNYSATGLAKTWRGRYAQADGSPNPLALRLHRKPMEIANHTYANRMGNGPPSSGDGWRYRGRGPIQITGKDMYQRCGDALGLTLVEVPALVLLPVHGARIAAWVFAVDKQCNALADAEDLVAVTRRINGELNGLSDRALWHRRAQAVVATSDVA